MSESVYETVYGGLCVSASSWEGGKLMCEWLQELSYQAKPAAEQILWNVPSTKLNQRNLQNTDRDIGFVGILWMWISI